MDRARTRVSPFQMRRFETMDDALLALADHFDCDYNGPIPAVLMKRSSFADYESHQGQQLKLFAVVADGERLYVSEDGLTSIRAKEGLNAVAGHYEATGAVRRNPPRV